MTIDELRKNLTRLVDRYVDEAAERETLYALVSREPVPVKGILADLHKLAPAHLSVEDANLVQDVYFHYC
jgi:hypothetical protein